MKKSIIALSLGFSLGIFLFACGGGNAGDKAGTAGEKKDGTTNTASTSLPSFITQAEYDKAVQIIAGSDCLGCHQIHQKTNGPAYVDIAKKYEPTEANIDTLANKIIHGGSGNWGDIPMLPHPNIPREDARILAKYVLSLRNAQQ